MPQVEIEITGQAITARYGTLNTGDILRTDADFARHLVEDCSAAKYTQPKPAATESTTAKREKKRPAADPAAE